MKKALLLLLLASFTSSFSFGQKDSGGPLVLISIDGLKPDYVLQADKHGLQIPNLRRMLSEGAHALGVTGVLPTITYPSHTTLVTGVSPAKHGIVSNTPFDPFSKNYGGWYWYAEDIKVPTLWDVASQAGLTTANVDWPATVGAKITFSMPQYWRASTPDDHKIMRALSRPEGLMAEAEKVLGSYPEGNDYTVSADQQRARFNVYLLENKKPDLLLCYFSGLDEAQHASGPYSHEDFEVLEKIDRLVGEVWEAARKVGTGQATLCVVSDHGFLRVHQELRLNAAFREAGLIEVDDQGNVKSWEAYAWSAGGSAAIVFKNPRDNAVLEKTRAELKRLAANPQFGIETVLDPRGISKLGGFPDAAFVVGMREGYRISMDSAGPILRTIKPAGSHGFLPETLEMRSSFFIAGPKIPHGLDLGSIDMRDIAPTLAGLLGLTLPAAEGRNLMGN